MKKNILVVDDNEDVRDLISYDLLKRGYNVLFACNGIDALDVINSEKIDLLLSDIQMPGCDGITLVKKVREKVDMNPVCLLMTGFNQHTPDELYKIGVNCVFDKPVDRKALFNVIDKALKD